jgi:hypothetical protein
MSRSEIVGSGSEIRRAGIGLFLMRAEVPFYERPLQVEWRLEGTGIGTYASRPDVAIQSSDHGLDVNSGRS